MYLFLSTVQYSVPIFGQYFSGGRGNHRTPIFIVYVVFSNNIRYDSRSLDTIFNKKLKNVSCEYDRLNS